MKIRHSKAKEALASILAIADIEIGGQDPWDIQVHDDRLYSRVLSEGSLGLGEAYMDGWWDCGSLDELFARILGSKLDSKVKLNLALIKEAVISKLFNTQTKSRAFEVGERHYDIGNDLYEGMLDKRMIYTCGYWDKAKDLDSAQEAKLDLVCRKLGLKSGDRVLDIGCGWGGFLKFAAERYGISGVGVTVSKEQVALAQERCKGLPIEIRLEDYRDINEKFDHIVSLGMFEHVGYKNYRAYMKVAERSLKDGGLFLLHTIGGNLSVHGTDAWIEKYIFPNSMLPSMKQITSSYEGLFVMEDWHNFGADYDKTLMSWFSNFDRAWLKIRSAYSQRFYRMWKYYLLTCAGSFRARKNQLWQIVLSKDGVAGGYKSIR